MAMDMTGDGGVLSVPAEHLPGLIWLVVAPLAVWLLVCAAQALAGRGNRLAERFVARLAELSIAARAALFASLVGAGVHAALVQTHWQEDRTRALLFLVDTAAFVFALVWTLALRPHWRVVNLVVLFGTVGTYAGYLLRGWEELDLVGLLTTTIELSVALILLDPLQPAVGPARRRERWVVAAALPVALVSLLGTGAVASATNEPGSHHHHDEMPGMDMHDMNMHGMDMHGMDMRGIDMHGMAHMAGMGSAGHRVSLPTNAPAGAIRWPQPMGDMEPGMKMAGGSCTTAPTPSQQRAAVDLVNETVAAVAPYRRLAAARAAGYVPVTPTGLPVVHYLNPAIYRSATTGSPDPTAVPSLVYVNTAHGAVLAAAMYLLPRTAVSAHPPRPGGCLTQWHVHTNLCLRAGVVVSIAFGGICQAGSVNQVTPPMLHIWLAPVPGGPLAPDPGALAQVDAAYRLPGLSKPNGTA